MKKILTACLLIGLIYTPSIIRAFELPSFLEPNIADDIIQVCGNKLNLTQQEGVFNIFTTGNIRTIGLGGFQGALPLFSNKRSLYRFELNLLGSFYPIQRQLESLKLGFSGRYIINPSFILGGYLFHDIVRKNDVSTPISKLINPGVEFMFPKHGPAIVMDGVLDPHNFFEDNEERFYQGSIKFSVLKPQIFDLLVGVSATKYPNSPRRLMITLPGIKFRVPFHKWNINKWFTVGIGTTYTIRKSWVSSKNFGGSLYLQLNFLHNPKNSLRDYLRMPIDRFFAIPYHPGLL